MRLSQINFYQESLRKIKGEDDETREFGGQEKNVGYEGECRI